MAFGIDFRWLAIVLAVLAAVALAFGAQLQNDSVVKSSSPKAKGRGSLSIKQLFNLWARPRWVSGMALMVVGIILQLAALTLAPLIVVQPIGAVALVITSILNSKINKVKLNRQSIMAVALCTFGIAGFVAMATGVAREVELNDDRLREVLFVLLTILAIFGVLFAFLSKHVNAFTYIIGAGVLYGFVATLAKVVIQRTQQGQFEWLTVFCLLGLVLALALGGWFVQNAYASGPPDLVIAGLTVIDPLVAVSIGIVILGEAQTASGLTIFGFGLTAIVAVVGVWWLSRVHPELTTATGLITLPKKR